MKKEEIYLKNLIDKVTRDMELIQRGFTSMVMSEPYTKTQGNETRQTVDMVEGVGDEKQKVGF